MEKKTLKKIKLLVAIVVILFIIWFVIVSPMITFHNNEKVLQEAAERYFDLNPNQLPTGERIKTVTLNTLYHKAFLEKDIFIPYTKKTCSVDNSWVKVRRENGEYKYYVYLECGVLSSNIDHKGPEIKLNGEEVMKVSKYGEYKEPGVKSVIDDHDGNLKVSDVTIKGSVDTSKIGTYEIKYIAFDSMKNKTEVVRKVEVVQKLYETIKKDLKDQNNYMGDPTNNYLRLSNMVFRIYGVDDNKNVIIVSEEDLANVNYSKLDKWLDYYYEQLNSKTKKMIVDSKFCNMRLSDTTLDTTKCDSYTEKRKVYVPSIIDINKANGEFNFMKTRTISWTANTKSDKEAYVTKKMFVGTDSPYLPYDISTNYGVRPMMVIDGKSLIVSGIGTADDPYTFGDVKKAKGGSKLNERFTGEYVYDGGSLWRIIKVEKDGTTKVVAAETIVYEEGNLTFGYTMGDKIIYNPKNKGSVGYFINNRALEYVDTENLTLHEIEVPIYDDKFIYGEEKEKKKYKVLLSAPNMYEIFSASTTNSFNELTRSYWFNNTSKKDKVAAVYDLGAPVSEAASKYSSYGIRLVGYFKEDLVIASGNGTRRDPYLIK